MPLSWTRAGRAGTPLQVVLEDIHDLFAVRALPNDDPLVEPVLYGGTQITLSLRKEVELEDLASQVARWLVFLEFPIEVVVDDGPPQPVWGIRGDSPEEVAEDIARRAAQHGTSFCPIIVTDEQVRVVVLWEAERLGDDYLLAPAGRYLLPLTTSLASAWLSPGPGRHGRAEEKTVRKIANGGVFLAEDLPGFKVSEGVQIHYVVDCRGEKRFTPLVSRGGIAEDRNSYAILGILIKAITDYLTENVRGLLQRGVSKYFCAYYAARAMGLLFDRSRMEKFDEKVLSVILAAHHGRSVPMLLVRDASGISLRSWSEHQGRPVVVGKNMYDGLLRAVAYGTIEFPLPTEVIESLPEHCLVSVGSDNVTEGLLLAAGYRPTAVKYEAASRGIFVECAPGDGPHDLQRSARAGVSDGAGGRWSHRLRHCHSVEQRQSHVQDMERPGSTDRESCRRRRW